MHNTEHTYKKLTECGNPINFTLNYAKAGKKGNETRLNTNINGRWHIDQSRHINS